LIFLALAAFAQDPDRGAAIAAAAGCTSCHTADDGPAWAGGDAIVTKFGTFYASNLTPDLEHGIGAWSEEDFFRAMRKGKSPDGKAYWPTFPYPSYTRMTDADLRDLFAFLGTVEPVALPDVVPEDPPARVGLGLWRMFEFRAGAFEPDERRDAEWNRGAYLVRAVVHCGECHTPRNGIGGVREGRELSGSDMEPNGGPNLTPHADGIGGWSASDLDALLTLGMEPDGDFVGGHMADVVTIQTAPLSPEDRRAIGVYLAALKPLPTR